MAQGGRCRPSVGWDCGSNKFHCVVRLLVYTSSNDLLQLASQNIDKKVKPVNFQIEQNVILLLHILNKKLLNYICYKPT